MVKHYSITHVDNYVWSIVTLGNNVATEIWYMLLVRLLYDYKYSLLSTLYLLWVLKTLLSSIHHSKYLRKFFKILWIFLRLRRIENKNGNLVFDDNTSKKLFHRGYSVPHVIRIDGQMRLIPNKFHTIFIILTNMSYRLGV